MSCVGACWIPIWSISLFSLNMLILAYWVTYILNYLFIFHLSSLQFDTPHYHLLEWGTFSPLFCTASLFIQPGCHKCIQLLNVLLDLDQVSLHFTWPAIITQTLAYISLISKTSHWPISFILSVISCLSNYKKENASECGRRLNRIAPILVLNGLSLVARAQLCVPQWRLAVDRLWYFKARFKRGSFCY